jgi:hypothetical protein
MFLMEGMARGQDHIDQRLACFYKNFFSLRFVIDTLFLQTNTRQGSVRDVNINVPEKPSGVTTRSRAPPPIGLGRAITTGDLFESYNVVEEEFEHEGGNFQEESSMRVMYEDPGQRDEKKRLMNLLKNQAGGEEDSLAGSSGGFGKKTRRRSVRIAGF